MFNIQFNDHPVCQIMADKAMYDHKYNLQLEKSASGKGRMNVAIEDDMTKIRHKIVMLNKLECKTHQHNREMRNAEFARDPKCALISAGRASANSRRALKILAENQRLQNDPKPFPFIRLPLEIRQQIYEEVLRGSARRVVVKSFHVSEFKQDFLNRDIETFYGNRASPRWKNPASTFENGTNGFYGKDITTGLLLVSRSIYSETVPILYRSRTFDFGIDIFGIIPFLRNMTPLARNNVQSIHMEFYSVGSDEVVKPSYQNHWNVRDNVQDWNEACAYISDHLKLKELSINVHIKAVKATDPPANVPQLHWVKDLVSIRDLKKLTYHVSLHDNGLQSVRRRRLPPGGFVPGPDDVVDGDLKGAKPGLGKLFRYLREEMLEKSMTGGLGIEDTSAS